MPRPSTPSSRVPIRRGRALRLFRGCPHEDRHGHRERAHARRLEARARRNDRVASASPIPTPDPALPPDGEGRTDTDDRHFRREEAILAARARVYARARERHPERWPTGIRDWTPVGAVHLNPEADPEKEAVAA